MKKTWQEKMVDKPSMPKILKLETTFPCYNAAHKMGANAGDEIILVNPSEVARYMQAVPYGRLTTLTDICKAIAAAHQVKACCSLTTGIFTMTIANAMEEMNTQGKDAPIPYWRTLKADGSLNPKYPGGQEGQQELLAKEGFTFTCKGKRILVNDYERFLITKFIIQD